MSTQINDSLDSAKDTLESAKTGTKHALSAAATTLIGVLRDASGVVTTVRDMGASDVLGWFGLAKRRGPMRSISMFGAGALLGAGVGILVAPRSGRETRDAIWGWMTSVGKDVARVANKVETGAKELEQKAEAMARSAKVEAVNIANSIADSANTGGPKKDEPAKISEPMGPPNHRLATPRS